MFVFFYKNFAILSIFCLLNTWFPLLSDDAKWKEVKKKDSISVSIREFPGSEIEEFIGKTEVEASLSQLVFLLSDLDSCKNIYFNCKELKVLSNSEKKGVVYIRNGAPWPVAERDVVLDRILNQDIKSKTVKINLKKNESVQKPSPPEVVRMDSFLAEWRLIPLGLGKVRIEYQAHFEPGGSVPNSIMNLAIIDSPYNTLLNLRNAVSEGKAKDKKIDWLKELD